MSMSMQQQGTYYYKNKKTRRRSIKIRFRNWIYLLLSTETHIFSKTRYVCLDNFIIGDSKIERMGAQEGDELKQQVTRTGIKYNSCKAIKNSEAGARTKKLGRHHHHHLRGTAAQQSNAGAVMQVNGWGFQKGERRLDEYNEGVGVAADG